MKKNPDTILREWMSHINRADVNSLAAMYSDNAVLIPTFSNRLLNNPQVIREYFERLSQREELSLALHEKTLMIHPVTDDIHVISGIYCWRFAVDGELLNFEARFGYMVNIALPAPIVHHHSSQIPRML